MQQSSSPSGIPKKVFLEYDNPIVTTLSSQKPENGQNAWCTGVTVLVAMRRVHSLASAPQARSQDSVLIGAWGQWQACETKVPSTCDGHACILNMFVVGRHRQNFPSSAAMFMSDSNPGKPRDTIFQNPGGCGGHTRNGSTPLWSKSNAKKRQASQHSKHTLGIHRHGGRRPAAPVSERRGWTIRSMNLNTPPSIPHVRKDCGYAASFLERYA